MVYFISRNLKDNLNPFVLTAVSIIRNITSSRLPKSYAILYSILKVRYIEGEIIHRSLSVRLLNQITYELYNYYDQSIN